MTLMELPRKATSVGCPLSKIGWKLRRLNSKTAHSLLTSRKKRYGGTLAFDSPTCGMNSETGSTKSRGKVTKTDFYLALIITHRMLLPTMFMQPLCAAWGECVCMVPTVEAKGTQRSGEFVRKPRCDW